LWFNDKVSQHHMIHIKNDFITKKVMMECIEHVDHSQHFPLYGSVVLFG